VSFDLI